MGDLEEQGSQGTLVAEDNLMVAAVDTLVGLTDIPMVADILAVGIVDILEVVIVDILEVVIVDTLEVVAMDSLEEDNLELPVEDIKDWVEDTIPDMDSKKLCLVDPMDSHQW